MTYQRTNYKILILTVCNLLEKNDGIVALIGPSELKLSLQMANLASSVWIFFVCNTDFQKYNFTEEFQTYLCQFPKYWK